MVGPATLVITSHPSSRGRSPSGEGRVKGEKGHGIEPLFVPFAHHPVIASLKSVAIHCEPETEPHAQFFAQGKSAQINEFDPESIYMFHRPSIAPVVQWIEHWSPEPKIWVRLPAGVPCFA
jgi:hypothetical protein